MYEVDPCDDLTDDGIRMAIQNASGARNALFVLEVFPFAFAIVFPCAFAIVSGETMDNWRWQQRISNLLLGYNTKGDIFRECYNESLGFMIMLTTNITTIIISSDMKTYAHKNT
ncbi:dynamin-related protein 3A [Prunus dulcis]|uniref:Dynamin-related protein 3A n=1 Tax=Prunus dulcis TaxID=3755 RepID=A0A4Y1QZX5_PRUDU|nr:dynamin-related protein 3A [Prunus dulcis]